MIRRASVLTLFLLLGLGTFSLASVALPQGMEIQRSEATQRQVSEASDLARRLGLSLDGVSSIRRVSAAAEARGVEVHLGELTVERLSSRDPMTLVTSGLPLRGSERRVVEVRGHEVLIVRGVALTPSDARRILAACGSDRPRRLLAVIDADGAYGTVIHDGRSSVASAVRAHGNRDLATARVAAHLAADADEALSVVAETPERVDDLRRSLNAIR